MLCDAKLISIERDNIHPKRCELAILLMSDLSQTNIRMEVLCSR